MRLSHLSAAIILAATASASAIPQAPNIAKALLSMTSISIFIFRCIESNYTSQMPRSSHARIPCTQTLRTLTQRRNGQRQEPISYGRHLSTSSSKILTRSTHLYHTTWQRPWVILLQTLTVLLVLSTPMTGRMTVSLTRGNVYVSLPMLFV